MADGARYWRTVHCRAWQLAKKAAGLETRERMIMVVVVQAVIALIIFFLLHSVDLWTRLASAAAPFLLLPIWYLLKFPTVPPLLADEAVEELKQARSERDAARAELVTSGALPLIDGVFQRTTPVAFGETFSSSAGAAKRALPTSG